MQPLAGLIEQARRDAGAAPGSGTLSAGAEEAEAARVMQICNACRYCEGFCAVFAAMTRRLAFPDADIHYLANLCHNCSACLHACQYAPPHEFAVNVPQAMAKVRGKTYKHYAWPPRLGALYDRNGVATAIALSLSIALFLMLGLAWNRTGDGRSVGADFYAVFPHKLMVALFGAAFGWAVLALGMSARSFWKAVAGGHVADWPARAEASKDALSLKYLGGGHGEGCNEESDRFTLARRWFHHLTFYGFMLCFASTVVATLYHYVAAKPAPYALTSMPVVLGTLGGIGMIVGTAGLAWLYRRRDARQKAAEQRPMDWGFIALLFFTSLTGIVLLAWRESAAMPVLLALHLGFVMALFLTLPYGKFAHAVYRVAALFKWEAERRRPTGLQLKSD
jgi:citrate/tricarballylate utilization protein